MIQTPMKQIDVPQELVNERIRRVVVDLFRRPDLLDLPLVHHHDPVRKLERLFLVMRDEDAGDMHLVMKLPQPPPQVAAHPRIQRAERFIQQQHPAARPPAPGASATRWRCPPESCGGSRSAKALQLHQRKQFGDAFRDKFLRGRVSSRRGPAARTQRSQTPSCAETTHSAERQTQPAGRRCSGRSCLRRETGSPAAGIGLLPARQ